MSKSDSQKIIIVGAGVAGLTAALCLCKSGHDVTVLEQAPALQDIGAGIQLSPNAATGGNDIVVLDDAQPIAVIPAVESRSIRSARPSMLEQSAKTHSQLGNEECD